MEEETVLIFIQNRFSHTLTGVTWKSVTGNKMKHSITLSKTMHFSGFENFGTFGIIQYTSQQINNKDLVVFRYLSDVVTSARLETSVTADLLNFQRIFLLLAG